MGFNLPSTSFIKDTISSVKNRVQDLPATLTQKANNMMTSVPFADARNLDARDLMARAANPNITGASSAELNSITNLRSSNLSGYYIKEYPENIGSERYPHYVAFFINEYILNGSKQEGGRDGTTEYLDDVPRNIDKYGQVGGGLSRGLSGVTDKAGNTINIGAKVKRTADAIILYTPNQMRQSYSAGYEQFTNASIVGSALFGLANANNVSEAMGVLGDTGKNILGEIGRGAIGAFAQTVGAEGAMSAIDKARGKIQNPRTEILFQSMGMRRHEFNYLFSPRNRNEAQKIEDIIRLFKMHMHPAVQTENDKTGNYLILPSEFDIEFYYKDKENNHVPKILTCVLEDMSVDYTPNSLWSTFDGDPFPTHISLHMQFKELEPLTAQHIKEGF